MDFDDEVWKVLKLPHDKTIPDFLSMAACKLVYLPTQKETDHVD